MRKRERSNSYNYGVAVATLNTLFTQIVYKYKRESGLSWKGLRKIVKECTGVKIKVRRLRDGSVSLNELTALALSMGDMLTVDVRKFACPVPGDASERLYKSVQESIRQHQENAMNVEDHTISSEA